MKYRVLVNAGGSKIYLQQTAQDFDDKQILLELVSGIIFAQDSKVRQRYPNSKILKRIYQRAGKIHCQKRIRMSLRGEFFWQFAIFLERQQKKQLLPQLLFWVSSYFFARTAMKALKNIPQSDSNIYHVRSGFGGASIKRAKELGYKIVVDHSIAHPEFLRKLHSEKAPIKDYVYSLDRRIRQDLSMADIVIVNSNFVAETFVESKFPGKVRVAIPPIEKSFSKILREISSPRSEITFIGRCEYRKGIDKVLELVRELDTNIQVNILGNWDNSCNEIRKEFERMQNVKLHAYSSMAGVVDILSRTRIFLFPSRAEGAARVVGEALHAGCAVFTTLEAGVPLPGGAGYVINGWTIEEVRHEINSILLDDSKFEIMSTSARLHILNLEKKYLNSLWDIYNVVLR